MQVLRKFQGIVHAYIDAGLGTCVRLLLHGGVCGAVEIIVALMATWKGVHTWGLCFAWGGHSMLERFAYNLVHRSPQLRWET